VVFQKEVTQGRTRKLILFGNPDSIRGFTLPHNAVDAANVTVEDENHREE
jgi:hypothetical protein